MLRFYAEKFHTATHLMAMFRSRLELEKRDNVSIFGTSPTEIAKHLNELSCILGELNLPLSKKNVDFISEKLQANAMITQEFRFAVDHLYRTLNDEIQLVTFFSIKPENAKLYDQKDLLFGDEVNTAFPSSTFDIKEAGRCLALERDTACVMHLMRALETPLQALAKDLSVNVKRDNWGDLLKEIEIAVLALSPKSDAERKISYSDACTQFRFFKDAWRNEVMHSRGKYTPEEANTVLVACHAFMKTLSKRLNE